MLNQLRVLVSNIMYRKHIHLNSQSSFQPKISRITSLSVSREAAKMRPLLILSLSALLTMTSAQLSGSVGPATSSLQKRKMKLCDVTNYGAVPSISDDLSGPLQDAINACADGGLSKCGSLTTIDETRMTC
jgi:hypothetical protein